MSLNTAEFNFNIGDSVVYPSHGVGRITDEEVQSVNGSNFKMLVITFDKDKMTLKVPKNRASKAGLRFLSSNEDFKKALSTLQGKAKVARGMWSKRAQEYELKINSGNVINIAEVLRDLHRNIDDPKRSYSEKVIYEAALKRFTQEYSVAANMNIDEANNRIKELLHDSRLLHSESL